MYIIKHILFVYEIREFNGIQLSQAHCCNR